MKKICREQMLSRLNAMRGLFAVEIVIGHVVRNEQSPVYLIGKFMIISVAFFFFVSAFGMSVSFEKKENYLKHFIKSKCLYLFLIAAVVFCFEAIIGFVLPWDSGLIGKDIIRRFVINTNWYIWEMIAFYLLFYLINRFIKTNGLKLLIMTAASLFIMHFSYVYLYESFYASSLAFPLGMAFGMYYDKICGYLSKPQGIITVILLTLIGLSAFVFTGDGLIEMVYLRNMICVASMLILTYIVSVIDFDCRLSRILGKYSTEIYLYQFMWLRFLENTNLVWQYKVPIALVLTFISAVIMHPVNIFIRKQTSKI